MADKGSVTERLPTISGQNIRNGNWTVGEKIPSENQLCEELGVSRVQKCSAPAAVHCAGHSGKCARKVAPS